MKLIKIIIGFLIVAVVVCGTVSCVKVNHSKNIDKEPNNTVKEAVDTINYGNIRQNGLIVQAGESYPMVSQHEVIFYHYWASDRGELMTLNCDTMERRTLCEGDIINPILDKGKVYYVDEWKQSINSIDINTLEKEEVYKFEGQTPWDIVKMDDYIYYMEDNAIIKISITTHQKEEVLSVPGRILSFGITPNAILATYSIDNGCKMHLVTY